MQGNPADATVAAKTESDATLRLSDVLGRLGARRSDIRRCAALARICGRSHEPAETAAIALLAATAEVFARRALDHPWRRSDVTKAVNSVSELTGLTDERSAPTSTRVALDPSIIQLPPAVAIETQLKVFYGLMEVENVSLGSAAFDGLRSASTSGEESGPPRACRRTCGHRGGASRAFRDHPWRACASLAAG